MPIPKALRPVGVALVEDDGADDLAGVGLLPDRVERHTEQLGPVHRDPDLASALAQLALGDEIPEQMWTAVAQVLAWAYGLSEKRPTPNR